MTSERKTKEVTDDLIFDFREDTKREMGVCLK